MSQENFPEIELRLRRSIPVTAQSVELDASGARDGDIVKWEILGNTIYTYINGELVQLAPVPPK